VCGFREGWGTFQKLLCPVASGVLAHIAVTRQPSWGFFGAGHAHPALGEGMTLGHGLQVSLLITTATFQQVEALCDLVGECVRGYREGWGTLGIYVFKFTS